MRTLLAELKTATVLTALLAILLGGAYPLVVWAGGQLLFRDKANGSLVFDRDGTVRGSTLLGQRFTSDRYFHSRPSAAGNGYDAANSSGTNLGPTSAKLADGVHARDAGGDSFDGIKDLIAAYRATNGMTTMDAVPADAVTRSASGLDRHISVRNAELQAARVAQSRGLTSPYVLSLIRKYTDNRDLGVLGEPGVNVLRLNDALDALQAGRTPAP